MPKHNDTIKAIRRNYMQVVKGKPRIKKDAHINRAFQRIIRHLRADAQDIEEAGGKAARSWDDMRSLSEEAAAVELPDEYEDILEDVIEIFHKAIDRAEKQVPEFERPDPV